MWRVIIRNQDLTIYICAEHGSIADVKVWCRRSGPSQIIGQSKEVDVLKSLVRIV